MNDSNRPASIEGHAEIALDTSFDEEVFAETAAVTMAIVKAIAELGSLSSDNGPYLSRILETGLRDLDEMDHRNVLNQHSLGISREGQGSLHRSHYDNFSTIALGSIGFGCEIVFSAKPLNDSVDAKVTWNRNLRAVANDGDVPRAAKRASNSYGFDFLALRISSNFGHNHRFKFSSRFDPFRHLRCSMILRRVAGDVTP
jgi:hypothetical protein